MPLFACLQFSNFAAGGKRGERWKEAGREGKWMKYSWTFKLGLKPLQKRIDLAFPHDLYLS